MSQCMRFPTMWYVRPAKPQISLLVKLLTEHHFEFLSIKGGCRGLYESTLVKMSNYWKSHAAAQMGASPFCTGKCMMERPTSIGKSKCV